MIRKRREHRRQRSRLSLRRSERASAQFDTKEQAVTVDRIGVGSHHVAVAPPSGPPQQKVLARLDVMERELRHVQTAITNLRSAVRSGRPGAPLASAVMNSRNWVLSILMSHAYVHRMVAAPVTGPGFMYPLGQQTSTLREMAERAISVGADDAEMDRR